jgi:ABC-2 type transport system ATP-binding protein
LLVLFELAEKADELVETYSHGMRQKLALAGAMLHEPPVLFLDEPTSGLDPRSARLVKDLLLGLVDRGHTVFFSTHVLEIAEQLCHRVGIVDRGHVVATGTLDELRQQSLSAGSLEDIFMQLTGGSEERELAAYLRGG